MLDALKGLFARPPARRAVHDSAIEADPVEALYQRAAAAFGAGEWEAAAATAAEAMALEPALPALHYLLGCCRLAQEQHASALQSFARCLELQPKYPLSAETRARHALCRARIDLASGKAAAIESLAPQHKQSVSALICSRNPERFAQAEAMYHRLLGGTAARDHRHPQRALARGRLQPGAALGAPRYRAARARRRGDTRPGFRRAPDVRA